ncbi:MAG: hypothetical protein JNM27_01880 [Leptospirales bacterium]|nr:hypothetical protein [Leptospirales bacterium]
MKYQRVAVVVLLAFGCSVGGNDVISDERFDRRLENAIATKLAACAPYPGDSSSSSQTNADLNLANLIASGFLITLNRLFHSPEHYTEKDANFCIAAILFTPCVPRSGDQLAAVYTQKILFCYPGAASFWDRQHFGQGDLFQ